MSDWAGDITIGLGWVYYDGPVGHTQFHRHYAVQVCFPFSGPLHIETQKNTKRVDDVLVIGSNVSHRLSTPSRTAKLLYIEPNLIDRGAKKLTTDDIDALDIPASRLMAIEQMLDSHSKLAQADFGLSLARLIWPEEGGHAGFSVIDPRIQKSLADIDAAEDLNISLSQIVGSSGLSASRFRHLFSAQIGMPLKSYLLWIKLQRAFQSLATDSSLTHAAHIAGFSDSSHLSRTFKRTFGLTPADLNKNAHFTTRKRG